MSGREMGAALAGGLAYLTPALAMAEPPEQEAISQLANLIRWSGVFTSVFDIYASTEMAGWLDRVECPVLVLTAEHDGGCNPRLNRQIADALPDAELVIMPDLKHSILLEAPGKVAEHVAEFLTRRF